MAPCPQKTGMPQLLLLKTNKDSPANHVTSKVSANTTRTFRLDHPGGSVYLSRLKTHSARTQRLELLIIDPDFYI